LQDKQTQLSDAARLRRNYYLDGAVAIITQQQQLASRATLTSWLVFNGAMRDSEAANKIAAAYYTRADRIRSSNDPRTALSH